MSNDKDIRQIYEDCYKHAETFWRPCWVEMKKDLRFLEDDQLSGEEKAALVQQRRQPYIFNYLQKNVDLLTGYERKTRVCLKVGPENGVADWACNQHSKVLMHIMNRNAGKAWEILSDSFEMGTLVSGANLVSFWPDRNGDIDFGRRPYNKFLLDPNFSNLDLSDCQYIINGEALTKEQAKKLLPPDLHGEVDKAFIKGAASGDFGLAKWPFMTKQFSPYKNDLRRYEEFWRRTTKRKKLIVNKRTGQMIDFDAETKNMSKEDRDRIKYEVAIRPTEFSFIQDDVPSIELSIFFNGFLLNTYDDPYGIGDYNCVLIAGYFRPEEGEAKYKLAPLIRRLRDPQRAENRRMMQMIDMVERQITTGWKVKENVLVNPEALYQSGQGVPVIFKKDANINEDAQEIAAKDIPQGFFNLEAVSSNKIMTLLGISEETFGAGEKDLPMGLWALRQGAALTIFQKLFSNFRHAKKQLGCKLVRMEQANFPPQKIMRITGEQIAPGYYAQDFEKYDCQLVEGIFTDTQRQMAYAEVIQLRQMGFNIPDSVIYELMPTQLNDHIKRSLIETEQQKQQIQMAAMQLQAQGAQAKIAADTQQAQQKAAQAELQKAQTVVERVRAAKDLQQMQLDKINSILDRLVQFEEMSDRKFRREAIVRR